MSSSYCEHCGNGAKCVVCGRNDNREAESTARFWFWHTPTDGNSGWVRLSVRAGETRELCSYQQTDEGFDVSYQRWHHDGAGVQHEWACNGRDCDGGYDFGGVLFCAIDRLSVAPAGEFEPGAFTPPGLPDWQPEDSYQRDHYAEAAGY